MTDLPPLDAPWAARVAVLALLTLLCACPVDDDDTGDDDDAADDDDASDDDDTGDDDDTADDDDTSDDDDDDGLNFVFAGSQDSGVNELNFELYRYDNGTVTRLTTTPDIEQSPTVDGSGRVWFTRQMADGHAEVFSIAAGGGDERSETSNGAEGNFFGNRFPALAPDDGRLFVTTDNNFGGSQVLRAIDTSNGDTSELVGDLLDGQGTLRGGLSVGETPDGDKLYFAQGAGDALGIFRANLDGSGVEPVGSSGSFRAAPLVSGDGTLVAYSQGDGNCQTQIAVMDHDGGNAMTLTSGGGHKHAVAWSGDQIVFASDDGGTWTLSAIGSAGGDEPAGLPPLGGGHALRNLPGRLAGVPGPVLRFDAGPRTTGVGEDVSFYGTNDLTEAIWNSHTYYFGDGQSVTDASSGASHSYSAAGIYYVTLLADNTCGQQSMGSLPFVTIE